MKIVGYIILGLLIIALMILIPFGFIWSINTLFSLSVAYTIKTWLASLLILILIGNTGNKEVISIKKESKCCRNQ
jgi:hypothetical protein